MITADQIRAARALLRLDQDELARRARISTTTLRRLETASARVAPATIVGVRRALEAAGAEFIADGVRRRRDQPKPEALFQELRAIAERSAECLAGLPRTEEADLYDERGLPA